MALPVHLLDFSFVSKLESLKGDDPMATKQKTALETEFRITRKCVELYRA